MRYVRPQSLILLIAAERVGHHVSRDRARPDLLHKVLILRRLRCRKLKAENLLALRRNLLVLGLDPLGRECIQHRTGVGVLVLDDVPRAVLDNGARLASLRGEVVIDVLNRALRLAAAIRRLRGHILEHLHQRGLLVGAGKLRLRKAVRHLHLHAVGQLRLCVESVTQSVVHAINFPLDVGEITC